MGGAPFEKREVGLTGTLLGVGVRCVLSSPWPHAVDTAKHWLSAFLQEAKPGAHIADACFNANVKLRERFTGPQDYLAMNVFGDPWLPFESVQPVD